MTATLQLPPAARLPPLKLSEVAPAAGANVGAPQPDVVAFGGLATIMAPGATGNTSVKATPARALFGLGLLIVNVSRETPPGMIGVGENCLAMPGGDTAVSVAFAVPVVVVPVSVVDRNPLMFRCGPAVVAVTLTLTVHDPLAGIVPPVGVPKLRLVDPATGAQLGPPVQVVLAAGVAATCRPAGNTSVNVAPVSAAVFVLVRVKVSVEVAPTATGSGANALPRVGLMPALQPVKTTSSRTGSEPGLVLPAL